MTASGIDESPQTAEPAVGMVVRLARAKALEIAALRPDAWIIGSDQAAVLDDGSLGERILGKPGTRARCIDQLRWSSGRTVSFLTAVAVVRGADSVVFERLDTTRVKFRTLDDAAIERYVAAESPLDCAGGFKSEGLGLVLCESIESTDPSALIGLPLIGLAAILRDVGFQLP